MEGPVYGVEMGRLSRWEPESESRRQEPIQVGREVVGEESTHEFGLQALHQVTLIKLIFRDTIMKNVKMETIGAF